MGARLGLFGAVAARASTPDRLKPLDTLGDLVDDVDDLINLLLRPPLTTLLKHNDDDDDVHPAEEDLAEQKRINIFF